MFILINLKAYDCDPGTVARAASQLETPADVTLGIAPQPSALPIVADSSVEAWSQHIDPIEAGSHTGHIRPAAVATAGATGTLLNHSERRLTLDAIDTAVSAAATAGLQTIVCANTPEQVRAVAALGPDAIAIEPPALIGTGTPVSQANPDLIRDAVAAATAVDSDIDVYCGAGISTGDDVVAARDLGADGVLLASGVAKAADPQAALADLVREL